MELQALYEQRDLKKSLVFASNTTSGRVDIKKAWQEALKRAGITNCRRHDMRHTKDKPYNIAKYFVPHDANTTEYRSGLTRVQIARNHGVIFSPVSKLSVQEGIDAVRNIFNRCWFDEMKCAKGVKSLENYRKQWDDRHGCWKDTPIHDFSSDGADAFRYLAISIKMIRPREQTQQEKKREQKRVYDNYLIPFTYF